MVVYISAFLFFSASNEWCMALASKIFILFLIKFNQLIKIRLLKKVSLYRYVQKSGILILKSKNKMKM